MQRYRYTFVTDLFLNINTYILCYGVQPNKTVIRAIASCDSVRSLKTLAASASIFYTCTNFILDPKYVWIGGRYKCYQFYVKSGKYKYRGSCAAIKDWFSRICVVKSANCTYTLVRKNRCGVTCFFRSVVPIGCGETAL